MCIGCCLAGLGLSFVVVVVRRRRRRRQHQSPRTVNIKNARFGHINFATTNSFLENDVGTHACKGQPNFGGKTPNSQILENKRAHVVDAPTGRGRRPLDFVMSLWPLRGRRPRRREANSTTATARPHQMRMVSTSGVARHLGGRRRRRRRRGNFAPKWS